MAEQNFDNHTKFVPLFHVYVLGVLALNFLWSLYHWKMTGFSLDGLVSILLASALVLLAFFARIFALTVQDRVIRLEERLRYERVLPADLRPRIGEFMLSQIVSMRFASDAELPALARKVLDEKLCDRKAIKQLIKNWKPDYLRA
jgi:dolichyl-phosphate-mannose--protein O-mannosyl transferase